MDERKEQKPPAGRRATLPPPSVRLSPVQEAWQRYVRHSLRLCDTCRRVDGSACEDAETLYADYQRIAHAAMDHVAGRAPLPDGQ
ncbi:hypothetical protein GCM10010293_41310 [Streptomyces griseoflavus]|uniref:hypothetical protein n=1 Tax=Streptomyces griseoflavus TaxID=35619 RepID=UPI00167E57D3|nr:hypothetical protein [Streptomyces griseoflavus]GGV37467.1 hypothetical protein GCM10010293_41310 [Streptomyces griseoflavus]